MRVLTVSLICACALWRFSRRVAEIATAPWVAPLVTLAVGMGTTYLFYARSFFSHAWTAALLFLSWDLIRAAEASGARRPRLAAAGAGLLAALAAISEYTVAPIAVLLALRVVAGRSLSRATAFGLAALVPLAALLAYNAVCFGSPLTLSSALEADPSYAQLVQEGNFGFRFPSPKFAAYYLFHPARGVLVFSPFLLWAIPGAVRWWRSRERRADWWFFVGGTVVLLVAMAGYPNWHGGWALGSRYLVPAVFFAAMPVRYALGSALSRGLFLAATAFSVANHLVLTSSVVYFPKEMPWPAATGSLWLLRHGWFAENLGMAAGLPGWISGSDSGRPRPRGALHRLDTDEARPAAARADRGDAARRRSARRAPAPPPGAALPRAALARGGARRVHGPRPPAPGAPDGRLGSRDPRRARARIPDVADVRPAARGGTRRARGARNA